MNIASIWGFLLKHLLLKLWFWITLTISLAVMLLGVPVLAPAGQIIFGILISPFVIILIWFVILTMRASKSNTGAGGIKWGALFMRFAGFILLAGMGSCLGVYSYGIYKVIRNPKPQATSRHTERGRDKYLFRFSDHPSGIIVVDLVHGNVDFYPKGGEITITPPLPAKPWIDKPGTDNPRGILPPGRYIITKSNPEAWGVEVWN